MTMGKILMFLSGMCVVTAFAAYVRGDEVSVAIFIGLAALNLTGGIVND